MENVNKEVAGMDRVAYRLLMAVLLCTALPLTVNAVSPSTVLEEREERIAKGIKAKGETVCLFQSGTEDVKRTISAGDLLTVYRENGKHDLREVGKIKVLSYIGEDYLKGEVVEGEVQTGDIAKKGDVASLVISAEDKCK
jgi:hypothetical protein